MAVITEREETVFPNADSDLRPGIRATVCYMSSGEKRVGVRQLRQNLSVYLRRVKRGQTYEVSERGRLVALLTPAPENSTAMRRLVSTGRASAPAGDLLALEPPPRRRRRKALSGTLAETRADRL